MLPRVHSDLAGPQFWSGSVFRERVTAWVDARLQALGHERTGELSQPHLRPWATALRCTSSLGVVWLKATCPGTAFEVAVYPLLEAAQPERVLRPLALEPSLGWLLLPDGGLSLRDTCARADLQSTLERVMAQYAELQLALAPQARALIDAGVSDMRPAHMLERFDQALACVAPHVPAAEREVVPRLEALRGRFAGWCEELAACPGAATLDHGDLHLGNVFAAGTGAGAEARFYDWGDSVVAHPFSSLLVALRVAATELETDLRDPRVARVRDAYLEPFALGVSRAEQVEIVRLARRVSRAARALVWDRALADYGRQDPEYGDAPFQALKRLLDPD